MPCYLALGDSLSTGYGVELSNSFPVLLYQKLLSLYPGLTYKNLAVNGYTSDQLTWLIRQPQITPFITDAQLITITIGSNDLLNSIPSFLYSKNPAASNKNKITENFEQNLNIIGQTIRSLNMNTKIKIATLYNPPALDSIEYAQQIRNLADKLNSIIQRSSVAFGAQVISLDQLFKSKENKVLGPDHLHPNSYGQYLMAQTFAL